MRYLPIVCLLATLCSCRSEPPFPPIERTYPDYFSFWRRDLRESPFPYGAGKAQRSNMDWVRNADPTGFKWKETARAKFFSLPGTSEFQRHFRAYGWVSGPKGLAWGFMVTDLKHKVLFWKVCMKPSWFGAIDLQQDGDVDILMRVLEYGNAGGRISEFAYVNEKNSFKAKTRITVRDEYRGNTSRVGRLTWVSHPTTIAFFDGEEVEMRIPKPRWILTDRAYRVYEEYIFGDSSARIGKRICKEIPLSEARYLSLR